MKRFSKFFHQLIRRKILYTPKDLHIAYSMLLHYLAKFENTKSYRIFTLNVTINMLNQNLLRDLT